MFSQIKIRLSSSGFIAELEEMIKHNQVSPVLTEVLKTLIERRQSKRKRALTDLPLMTYELRSVIMVETDEGRIMLDGECFQLLVVISECSSKPPRLKMVRTECPSCVVLPVSMWVAQD